MKHFLNEQNKYYAADFFKTSPQLVLDDFVVHILSNRFVIVENYKCVQNFSRECLTVKGKKKKLYIKGNHLKIRYFGDGEVEVTGNIMHIEFLEL